MFSFNRGVDALREPSFAPYRSLVLNDLHRNFPDLLYNTEAYVCPCINHMRNATTADFYREHATYWMNRGSRAAPPAGVPVGSPAGPSVGPSVGTSAVPPVTLWGDMSGVNNGMLGGLLGGLMGSRESVTQSPIVMPQINIEIAGMDMSGGDNGGDDIMSIIMNGIMGRSNLFQGLGENMMGSMMDPVVVSLNLSSLRANTVLEYGVEGICAVCQDDISAVEIVRKIKKCGHKFHVDCVDKWFEGSVKCPECRWDVRESPVRQEDVD